MKYIIEIDDIPYESNGRKLWKASAFNTLVFDNYGLDRLEQIQEQRLCMDCEYGDVPYGQYPCEECCHYHGSKYKPKPEEIQVGDEVELWGEQGVVVKSGRFLTVLDREFDAHVWNPEGCKRTGRTYPELIKALESLPKE